MKILIGGLVAESNAYVAKPCEIQDFVIQTGEDIAHRMYLTNCSLSFKPTTLN